MKKIVMIVLALVLTFSFSAVALADSVDTGSTSNQTCQEQVKAFGNNQGIMGAREGLMGEGQGTFNGEGPRGEMNEQMKAEREQNGEATHEAFLADHPEATELVDELETYHEESMEAREAKNITRQELHEALHELRADGVELDDETLAQLQEYREQIRDIHDTIREDRGSIHDILSQIDSLGVDEASNAIGLIHKTHLEQLSLINSVMLEMVDLVS